MFLKYFLTVLNTNRTHSTIGNNSSSELSWLFPLQLCHSFILQTWSVIPKPTPKIRNHLPIYLLPLFSKYSLPCLLIWMLLYPFPHARRQLVQEVLDSNTSKDHFKFCSRGSLMETLISHKPCHKWVTVFYQSKPKQAKWLFYTVKLAKLSLAEILLHKDRPQSTSGH